MIEQYFSLPPLKVSLENEEFFHYVWENGDSKLIIDYDSLTKTGLCSFSTSKKANFCLVDFTNEADVQSFLKEIEDVNLNLNLFKDE